MNTSTLRSGLSVVTIVARPVVSAVVGTVVITVVATGYSAEAGAQTAEAPSLPASAGATATGPATAGGSATTIEAVMITGQKVSRDLQKSALAVTAISGASLDQAGVSSAKDLDVTVPGLVANSTPSNPLTLTIRGVGYEGIQNNSAQPGVSYNLNGIYISNPVSLNANFLDVDQIEVLRGPQGTVLGQNSDGGALNVTTVRPTLGAFKGFGDFSDGSFGYERARAAINIPIGEDLAIRTAFQQQRSDGYMKAYGVLGSPNGYKLGNENSYNARVDLLWNPSDPLTVELWGEYYNNNSNGDGFKNINDPLPDPYSTTANYPSKLNAQSNVVAGKVSYAFANATANVLVSYQHGKLRTPEDLDKLDDATALRVYGLKDVATNDTRIGNSTTQEIDLISKPGGDLDWIIGAFSVQQQYHETFLEYQYTDNVADPLTYFPKTIDDAAAFAGTAFPAFVSYNTQKLRSTSVYGQGTFHLSDRFRATAGVRDTLDSQDGAVSTFFAPNVDTTTGFHALTGKAVLEYDVLPENTVYGMVSTGIKPGGTNLNLQRTVVPLVFGKERNTALEIGAKNQFLDQKVRFNVAAFYNFYKGLQVDSEDPIPFQGGLTNLGDVRTYGIEAELSALLPYNLRFDGNVSGLGGEVKSHDQLFDPEIDGQIDRIYGGPFAPGDIAARTIAYNDPSGNAHGKKPPKLPDFSMNLGLSHVLRFGDGGSFTSHVRYAFRDSYYFRIYNNPTTDLVPALRQIDLDFTYRAASGRWHADLVVKNLADQASVNARYTDNFGVGGVSNYYVAPRSYIGRVGYTF